MHPAGLSCWLQLGQSTTLQQQLCYLIFVQQPAEARYLRMAILSDACFSSIGEAVSLYHRGSDQQGVIRFTCGVPTYPVRYDEIIA